MKTKVGHMACVDCGHQVAVKENENGTLSFSCDECDAAMYAKKSATNNAIWRKRMTPIATAAPAKPAAPAKKESSTII